VYADELGDGRQDIDGVRELQPDAASVERAVRPGDDARVADAAGVWLADFGCLLCAFGAVRAAIPWSGVLLAYGVAEVAGMLPVVPGGIGIVEGSLAAILAAYGANRASALATALGFRLVSFWLAVALGWITVAVLARRSRRRDGPS